MSVEFQEPIRTTEARSKSSSSFVSFLIKRGIVKDDGQGQLLLIVIALICFALAGYFFSKSMETPVSPDLETAVTAHHHA